MNPPRLSRLRPIFRAAATVAVSLCISGVAFGQGSLTPPGLPAPTMKSLDQIASSGIAINATNTPGDNTSLYIITNPGSYYLSGNVSGVSGKKGIAIKASNVTVDLNGFALIGVAGSAGGIVASPLSLANVSVKNGSATSWGSIGIDVSNVTSGIIHDIASANNGDAGISTGGTFVVRDCVAHHNGGQGIAAGSGSTVQHCTSSNNAFQGIFGGDSSSIIDCVAFLNPGGGILAGDRSLVTDCVASANLKGSGAGVPTGIFVFNRCTVSGCTASENDADGIKIGGSCFVVNNNCHKNGGNGIVVVNAAASALNRIDGNFANNNGGHGISWINDFVVRNACIANTGTNYDPDLANGPNSGNCGPLQAARTATSPWANF